MGVHGGPGRAEQCDHARAVGPGQPPRRRPFRRGSQAVSRAGGAGAGASPRALKAPDNKTKASASGGFSIAAAGNYSGGSGPFTYGAPASSMARRTSARNEETRRAKVEVSVAASKRGAVVVVMVSSCIRLRSAMIESYAAQRYKSNFDFPCRR